MKAMKAMKYNETYRNRHTHQPTQKKPWGLTDWLGFLWLAFWAVVILLAVLYYDPSIPMYK